MIQRARAANRARTWLTSLARDTRGNTLAIVAASIIPLAGMVGGGVDISRMYIVKTRLQHACDAGALAGRKQMGGGTWAFNGNAAQGAANRFFDANIQASPYGATALTRTFTEAAGKVSGTASATVPMTIMRVFGKTTETLSVTCDAEMRLPNTDVMFVLDTTGSMDDRAVSTDSQTKIQALKSAVKCFYEIVARLDTSENCTTGTPSGGTGGTVQIRFGFVPYASNVNVGRLLKTEWMADNWPYQSREARFTTVYDTTWNNGSPQVTSSEYRDEYLSSDWSTQNTLYGTSSQGESWCATQVPSGTSWASSGSESGRQNQQTTTSGNSRTVTWYTNQTGTRYTYQYNWRSSDRRCRIQRRTYTSTLRRYYTQTDTSTTTERQVFDKYNYAKLSLDVSGLKNGTGWNSSVTLPIGYQGASRTLNWSGCIEERQTVWQNSYSPIPAGAKDLDIDSAPIPGDATTQWGPALPEAIFARNMTSSSWNGNQLSLPDSLSASEYYNSLTNYCPTEAKKLQPWPDAALFESYVNGLTASGATFHDIGMLWGARLISPTGIFRSENEFTAQGAEIERHLIFMTDGEACTYQYVSGPYGLDWLDRRTTDPNQAPSFGCLTTGTVTQQINARTQAICTAVKNKNITLWVIWFGASNATIEGMMTNCATPGRFFAARNAGDLQSTFKSIADQISQLRLTR